MTYEITEERDAEYGELPCYNDDGSRYWGENDPLSSTVIVDDMLTEACRPFDYSFNGTSLFQLPSFDAPVRDGSWGIGLIVGPSGSGKTQLLKRHYGITKTLPWNETKAVASQVDVNKLTAVGLNSVPSWCRPYHVLSNGEQFRANMARLLDSDTSFDEFTSVVDRTVAKSTSHAAQRYIRQQGMTGLVFSSCHYDIIDWLQPDWIYDTAKEVVVPRGSLQRRPEINLDIFELTGADKRGWWKVFEKHHYLTADLNTSSRCLLGVWNDVPVAFTSALTYPSGTVKNAWRGHRTVVLPDYQGLGIGVRFSDALGQMMIDEGKRYFSKTAHPRMGEYRQNSPLWKPTSKNRVIRSDVAKSQRVRYGDMKPFTDARYSHEYIGEKK